jgi:exodeoxyribonuclease V alpha subunit
VLDAFNLDADHLALARELVRLVPGVAEDGVRALMQAALLTLGGQSEGSSRMPLDDRNDGVRERLALMGTTGPALRERLAAPDLATLVGVPGDTRPLLLDGDWLLTQRLWAAEQELADQVQSRRIAEPEPLDWNSVPPELFTDPVALTDEQRQAVTACLKGPLTLISGGPGTGKTTIVVAILRALWACGLPLDRIQLAAPTAKAAQNMGKAIRKGLAGIRTPRPADPKLADAERELEPRTLHRLLRWHEGERRFRQHEGNRLDADVVIVDEASMISLEMMGQLFRAMSAGGRLVLLGDADQLPSVEAGTAFRDLVAKLKNATHSLIYSHRMDLSDADGRHVYEVSQRLLTENPGDLREGKGALHDLAGHDGWKGGQVAFLEADEADVRKVLAGWFEAWLARLGGIEELKKPFHQDQGKWREYDLKRLEALFEGMDHTRILAPLRRVPKLQGVVSLNDHLHKVLAVRAGWDPRWPLVAGEPVLMRRNDYLRKLYNGDQGLVIRLNRGDGQRDVQAVVFRRDGELTAFDVPPLREHLDLAYALTVHQAQGSEFDQVILVLPREVSPLLTREVVYTALTRARKGVLILGVRDLLTKAVCTSEVRFSGFHAALSARGCGP